MSAPPSLPQLTPSQVNYSPTAQWRSILRQAFMDLRCAAPAIVQAFDPVKQVVTVQIAVSELVQFQGGPQWIPINPIYNVPIILPRAGGFALTLPIEEGDEGILIFCDACIDLWWANGGVQPPEGAPLVQPQFERRRHDLTDCGFYPGMWSQPNVLQNYSTESAQLRSDDGTVIIDVAEEGVTITAPTLVVNCSGEVSIDSETNISLTAPTIDLNGTVNEGSF